MSSDSSKSGRTEEVPIPGPEQNAGDAVLRSLSSPPPEEYEPTPDLEVPDRREAGERNPDENRGMDRLILTLIILFLAALLMILSMMIRFEARRADLSNESLGWSVSETAVRVSTSDEFPFSSETFPSGDFRIPS